MRMCDDHACFYYLVRKQHTVKQDNHDRALFKISYLC